MTLKIDNDKARRPLHFLNFGDQLHDELVSGWRPSDSGQPRYVDVRLFDDHAFFKDCEPGLFVLRASSLDPAAALVESGTERKALEAVAREAAYAGPERMLDLVTSYKRRIGCALEADARWLSAELSADLQLSGLRRTESGWAALCAESLTALMNPLAQKRKGLPPSCSWRALGEEERIVASAIELLRSDDATAACSLWSSRFPELDHALAVRLRVLSTESSDEQNLRALELEDAEAKLALAQTRGNRAQATKAENERGAAQDRAAMTRAFWAQRVAWLKSTAGLVRECAPREHLLAVLRVRRAPVLP